MSEEAKRYVVTAPYVTVKTMTLEGWRVVGLHEGAPLPADVDQVTIDNLLRKGLAGEVGNLPVAPADRDAAQMAAFHDAQVVAAEYEVEQAKERLELHKAAAEAAHKAADDASGDGSGAERVRQEAEQRSLERGDQTDSSVPADPGTTVAFGTPSGASAGKPDDGDDGKGAAKTTSRRGSTAKG